MADNIEKTPSKPPKNNETIVVKIPPNPSKFTKMLDGNTTIKIPPKTNSPK